jgi:dynein heavy chain
VFLNLVKKVATDVLKIDIVKVLEHLIPDNTPLSNMHIRSLFFGDYFKPDANEKIYDEITDLDELAKVMDK